MLVLPYRDHTAVRITSTRSECTLFEMKMLDGALIVWGRHYRPNEFSARLDEHAGSVTLVGVLRDASGPVVTFAECMEIEAPFTIEFHELPDDYDPSWQRDRT